MYFETVLTGTIVAGTVAAILMFIAVVTKELGVYILTGKPGYTGKKHV